MITIKIENFEGPLDLLLHLIEEKKMDIQNISISEVIDEYLDIINTYEKNNLKVKVEFLQMASILIEIKAFSILRKDTLNENKVRLESRLKEYKLFKEFSEIFSSNENRYFRTFSKQGDMDYDSYIIEHDNTILSSKNLQDCLNNIVLKLVGNKNSIKIDTEEDFTKEDAISIINKVPINTKTNFIDLLNGKFSKKCIVVLFTAILELYKENLLDIIIEENSFSIRRDY